LLTFKINNMRKLISGVFLILGLSSFAQEYIPSANEINQFFNTKTMVVLEDNPMMEYNYIIKDVMKKDWTITPFEFITVKEFEEKRSDPKYSFLIMTKTSFDRDNTGGEYNFLNVLLGGDALRIGQMPAICSVPLAYASVEEHSYIYKLGTLLRFVQNHIQLIKSDPTIVSSNVFKYYNDNIANMKGKTLYLVEDELEKEIGSAARVKRIYPGKFRFVTREEIEEAIKNRDPKVVFLHKVGPEGTKIKARCYKILIGAKDAKFYYFDYHMINHKKPDGLLEKDLKKVAKNLE